MRQFSKMTSQLLDVLFAQAPTKIPTLIGLLNSTLLMIDKESVYYIQA